MRRYPRYAAYGLAAVLLVAGAAYGISRLPKGPVTVHWHADWKVYVNDTNVRFTDRSFDMSIAQSRIHFHLPDDTKLHLEGPDDRLRLIDLFHSPLQGDISDTRIVLPAGSTHAGTFENSPNGTFHAYVKPLKGNWTELTSNVAQHSMTDGERVLLTYGNLTSADLARQQESVPAVVAG